MAPLWGGAGAHSIVACAHERGEVMSGESPEGLDEHHLRVERTARYYTMGAAAREPGLEPGPEPEPAPRLAPSSVREPQPDDVWYLCHGYRQSAARFLSRFRSIRDERRLLVAPEGLSRFYIQPAAGRHGAADRVGASWMTREDRAAEIADYVGYLDALDRRITEGLQPHAVRRRVVLGFSQGVHTVARWVALGTVRPEQLILWGAYLPSDLNMEAAAPRLRALSLTLVRGRTDETADPALQEAEEERLAEWDIPFRSIRFDGGHRIDDGVLKQLSEGT